MIRVNLTQLYQPSFASGTSAIGFSLRLPITRRKNQKSVLRQVGSRYWRVISSWSTGRFFMCVCVWQGASVFIWAKHKNCQSFSVNCSKSETEQMVKNIYCTLPLSRIAREKILNEIRLCRYRILYIELANGKTDWL